MYNLKKVGGTFKGIIGECLFKSTRRYAIITKFFNKNKYFKTFKGRFSKEEENFLNKNWFSIDAIEFDYTQKPRKVVLFEIKTLNKQKHPKPNWIPQITKNTSDVYNEAIKLGFDVKIAIIRLYDDWEFDIEITDFNKTKLYIDKPTKYDKVSNLLDFQ